MFGQKAEKSNINNNFSASEDFYGVVTVIIGIKQERCKTWKLEILLSCMSESSINFQMFI